MDRPEWTPSDVDVSRPSAARIYDYLLGGSHNFAVDREVAHQAMAAMPDIAAQARANRAFGNRAVRFLVDAGVQQFLDLGSGIPTVGSVHSIAADARVVYVDIDPVAVAHGQTLLADHPRAAAVQADLRRPAELLVDPEVRDRLDFTQPIAVLLIAVLHAIPDADDPYGTIGAIRDRLAPGSYLVIGHGTHDSRPEESASLVEISRRTPTPLTTRTREDIARFFTGFELVEPGLVWVPEWRPDSDPPDPERSGNVGGVGRRPAAQP